MNRRQALKLGFWASILCSIKSPAQFRPPRKGFPTVQLHTDAESAQFRVVTAPKDQVVFTALDSQGQGQKITVLSQTLNPYNNQQLITHLQVTGLEPNNDYRLISQNPAGKKLDDRTFSSLEISKPKGRVALVSCMMDVLQLNIDTIWQSLSKSRPEVILFLGDTCYADIGSFERPDGHWRRSLETRNNLDIFWWPRLIPVYAIWDDHDFGKNNADSTSNPIQAEAFKAFKTLFGFSATGNSELGPGVSFRADIFGVRIVLLDGRSFRVPSGPQKTYWGESQNKWLAQQVLSSSQPLMIGNGSQFFGEYQNKESVELTHKKDLGELGLLLEQSPLPAILASGDIHFSEVMKIETGFAGYETLEITSSAIHSSRPSASSLEAINPRRQKQFTPRNFVVVELATGLQNQLDINIQAFGESGNLGFNHQFTVKK